MKKVVVLSAVAAAVMMAGAANAAEIYNKDGNKLDLYGNAAVAEFDWHFTAVRRDNGQTQHTTGRESQVWAKIPNTGWRIVHVHYSGPAKTGVGEGY